MLLETNISKIDKLYSGKGEYHGKEMLFPLDLLVNVGCRLIFAIVSGMF